MDDGRHRLELAPEQVRRLTNPASLGFDTTEHLPPPERMAGQARAGEAIDFALEIDDRRYNLYVSGEPGTGRLTSVLAAVQRIAHTRPAGRDWCYVYHFEQPSEPRVMAFPAGMGRTFARDVDGFVIACRRELRRAFADDTYERQRTDLLRNDEARHSQLLDQLQQEALALGFLLEGTPSGLAAVPVKPQAPASVEPSMSEARALDEMAPPATPLEPQALSREEFEALPAEEQQRLRANREQVEALIARILPQIRAVEESARNRIRRLDRDVANKAVGHLADELAETYASIARVRDFVHHFRHDIVHYADVLRGSEEDSRRGRGEGTPVEEAPHDTLDDATPDDADALDMLSGENAPGDEGDEGSGWGGVPLDEDLRARPSLAMLLRRYKVNVLVAHKSDDTAPVLQEANPTYANLTGTIGLGVREGIPYTDHLMIRPGALHRADGGFLVVQARDLLSQERAWDAVKRMLRFGTITLENTAESRNGPASAALRPEPMPAHVKVILVGDRETYALLMERDPEFHQLFKVRADFDTEMPRTSETEAYYARFAGEVARAAQAPALTSGAAALLIEESSRWADDQQRVSTLLGSVSDLTIEACFWAKRDHATVTTRLHMAQAIAARERRRSLLADKLDLMVQQGTVLIDTEGEVIGQVNGLTVLLTIDHAFGKPVRITARTAPGWAGILDVERETNMGGPSHTKGVLILDGYLIGKFGQEHPLSLTASICFEQVYDEVDGDSASSAELYALLSSLASVPIKQSLAVTGSVNQRGEVQAVGGVTQKVEAFYRICRDRGLTGEQGVIIPRANVRNLMLSEEIVDAIRAHRFHVFAVSTIDEGIELLTGIPAGRPDPNGRYLEGTINARISQISQVFGERVRAFGPPLALGVSTMRHTR